MFSQNFLPLSKKWPTLYEYASKAEQYIYSDPHAAIVKLRCYAEQMVGKLYRKLSLYSIDTDNFNDRLSDERFKRAMPSDVLAKLHGVRVWGNKAAHGETIPEKESMILLKDAYLLGRWFYRSMETADAPYPEFSLPPKEPATHTTNSTVEELTSQLEQALAELAELQKQEQHTSSLAKEIPDEATLHEFTETGLQAASAIDMEPEATATLFNLTDAFAKYELSPGQADLVKKLDAFLKGRDENVFLLQGYAGTGKTFITKGLTEYFRAIGRNYVLAAPTGKASKVIATKTNSPAYTIHKTIYSFKDIKEFREEVNGSETYKFYAELAVNGQSANTVYIVDEASMISNRYQEAEFFRFGSGFLLNDFFKFVNLDHNDHRKKVIFIGDGAQLPPVGMNFSPALSESYLHKEYNVKTTSHILTDVVRQKGDSGIIKNSIMLRNSIESSCYNKLVMDDSFPDVHEIKYDEIVDNYFKACDEKLNNNAILIAFSNADVADYNSVIRKRFLPGCGDAIAPGDKVMANNNNNFYGFFISNGDFGIVRQVIGNTEIHNVTLRNKNKETNIVKETPIELRFRTVELRFRTVELRFRTVELGFRDENGQSQFFIAKIVENLLYSKQADLSSDESIALYVGFCMRHPHLKSGSQDFKDTLKTDPYFNAMRVKFGYAITCHKAQGSEWKHVFVKCKGSNTGLNTAYFRWLYTAITRASEHLHLVDPPLFECTYGIKPVGLPHSSVSPTQVMTSSDPMAAKSTIKDRNQTYVQPEPVSLAEASTKDDSAETFGLAEMHPLLLAIFNKVKEHLAENDIRIADITHHQYQESYSFAGNNETAQIKIWYKSNGTISSVTSPTASALSLRLVSLLGPLKGASLAIAPVGQDFNFPEPFLREFYEEVISIISEHGISVQNVDHLQYCQQYTFARGDEVGKFKFHYNGKKQFKKFELVANFRSHPGLVHDITQLLANMGQL